MHLSQLLIAIATFPIVFVGLAVALIFWPVRRPAGFGGAALADFRRFVARGDFAPPPLEQRFVARDGASRAYRLYGSGADLLVFMHGSGGDSAYLARFAEGLATVAGLRVATLDMRGHGHAPGVRGDVDRLDRQETDIADLVAALKVEGGGGRFFIGGHSIGGGLAIRYTAGGQLPRPDGLLLMSPYVSNAAPSARPMSGGWAHARVPRFAGIQMLHRFGIHAFDGLPVVQFAISEAAKTGAETPAYSWRLFRSVTPREDWKKEIASIACETLVLGAETDVIFNAEGYRAAFAPNPRVRVEIAQALGHFDLAVSDFARDQAAAFLLARMTEV